LSEDEANLQPQGAATGPAWREPRPARSFAWTPATILAIAASVALLCAGVGVGYYFIAYLPMTFQKEQARLDAAEKQKAIEASEQSAQAVQSDLVRKKAYQDCLDTASATYAANWNKSCQANADERQNQRDTCIASGNSTKEQCVADFPDLPRFDCRLATPVADQWNQALEADKARCLAQSKAGL